MSRGPKARYEELIATGALSADPAQAEAIDMLDALSRDIRQYQKSRRSLFGGRPTPPKGLYLWGGVGRGKTLLMDLFVNNAPIKGKKRIHFHEFMADIHQRIAAWRVLSASDRRKHRAYNAKAPDDPIGPVAHDIARHSPVICFDEFQVTDITDAMILGRLFDALFAQRVIVIATSNRYPDDLYKNGLNRQLFTPFIATLKEQVVVHELLSAQDYRLSKLEQAPVYYQPLGEGADQAMDAAWKNFICGATERSESLKVLGRTLEAHRTARGAARFTFDELCAQPLGARDYQTVVRHFNTIFLDRIPLMGPNKRNEAKRFVTLIDTIYDTRTKLVCSADGEPDELYPQGDGSFEFERTASRLMEMRSTEYLGTEQRIIDPSAGSDAS